MKKNTSCTRKKVLDNSTRKTGNKQYRAWHLREGESTRHMWHVDTIQKAAAFSTLGRHEGRGKLKAKS